ncbi:MAG: hypothetical protein A2010_10295 [Nitrospirae bacterium GWD2_57_9]|nr:MAG: hypothetical protein A2010_10295 [Nitrospirae bacterium GWD2_57_9]
MRKKSSLITSKEIGGRIKKRRSQLGISQEELAVALGVTYQQVQRYESGLNKLNVEKMQQVAEALSVPVSNFFENDSSFVVAEAPEPYLSREESRLLKHFNKIKDEKSKKIVIQLVKAMAEREEIKEETESGE